nr:MAG TPA: hypothetical protein [Caudoviricetes sp.]
MRFLKFIDIHLILCLFHITNLLSLLNKLGC